MRRREFITLLGGAALTWPGTARAQQPSTPVVGFLSGLASTSSRQELTAFHQGLSEIGFVDGKNVALAYRWADGNYAQLPALAADLVSRKVSVIVTAGNVATRAAKKATSTIPIVFHTGDDPTAVGLVLNLNNPNGNVTGVSAMAGELPTKRIELLHELAPTTAVVAAILNPNNANAKHDEETLKTAAGVIGLNLHILNASDENSLEAAFATVDQKQIGALIVNTDASFLSQRDQIIALAARHKIPTMYSYREWVSGGGLISYGAIRTDTYRQAGIYAGKILKGMQPKDLPVMLPEKFELVINLKTAKALGLSVPPSLLTRADEVIE